MKRLTVIGNIGRDPELRTDTQGNQFTVFSVAIATGNKDNPKTDWVEVSCNGKLGEIALNLAKKGNRIFVEGFPATHAYINNENEPISILRLYAKILEILNIKNPKIDFTIN